jgi:hypothetical protein
MLTIFLKNIMLYFKKIALVLVVVLLIIPSISLSQTEQICKDLEGKWEGEKVGTGYQGSITIIFKNDCNYSWLRPDGFLLTYGQLSIKEKEIFYYNQAGSRGNVFKKDSELKWINTFTGNSYSVIVKKLL